MIVFVEEYVNQQKRIYYNPVDVEEYIKKHTLSWELMFCANT